MKLKRKVCVTSKNINHINIAATLFSLRAVRCFQLFTKFACFWAKFGHIFWIFFAIFVRFIFSAIKFSRVRAGANCKKREKILKIKCPVYTTVTIAIVASLFAFFQICSRFFSTQICRTRYTCCIDTGCFF